MSGAYARLEGRYLNCHVSTKPWDEGEPAVIKLVARSGLAPTHYPRFEILDFTFETDHFFQPEDYELYDAMAQCAPLPRPFDACQRYTSLWPDSVRRIMQ